MNKVSTLIANQCINYINQINDINKRIAFIEGVKDLCEKKIFLEVEHARLTLQLVKLKENNENDLAAAAKIIENV